MIKFLKKEWAEFVLLVKAVPSILIALFSISVFSMNLLANKSINIPFDWLALDCGIIVSWFAFFTMDILTKHFGPKAATEITILAIVINLGFSLLLFIGSIIPGVWGESFSFDNGEIINNALNKTFGGTWYVIFGSTIAFVASSILNNLSNYGIGKMFKKNPDSLAAYICRAYISTSIAQFVDNLIFALLVSHFFFGWTIIQCLTCALTGMIVELLCEGIFFYPGYKIARRFKNNNVGREYFEYKMGGIKNESVDNGN